MDRFERMVALLRRGQAEQADVSITADRLVVLDAGYLVGIEAGKEGALRRTTVVGLSVRAAEDLEEEEEDVEDVQEDRGGQQWGGSDVLGTAQALEVDHRQAGEDDQAQD